MEAKEDEKVHSIDTDDAMNESNCVVTQNLTETDQFGKNALLLVASFDDRTISENKVIKNLSDKEKEKKKKKMEDYFKCLNLILEKISTENLITVLKETDNDSSNALMWCCRNGNIQGAKFIWDKCIDDKTRQHLLDETDNNGYNAFHKAIMGRNVDLIEMIHDLYKSFEKHDDLIKGQKALQVAFQQGAMKVVEWILFDLITDSKKRMEFLNGTISSCKSGRKTEEAAKRMATRILEEDAQDMKEEKDIKGQKEINNIYRVFDFMMRKELSSHLLLHFLYERTLKWSSIIICSPKTATCTVSN